MKYLSSAFSPSMLADGVSGFVAEIGLDHIPEDVISVVGHEVTARVLSVLLNRPVEFNRANITLRPGDVLYCVIPQFRANEAREFTREEIEAAGWRAFKITTA